MTTENKKTTVEQHIVTDAEAKGLPAMSAAADELTMNNLAINQQFGLDIYDRQRVENEIRFFMSQSAEAMLNAGKRLIQLRENEEHGNWLSSLERIGLDRTLAKRMMQAAAKFSNGALTHHLVQAAGNKTKLFELMVLDDEEIIELSEGRTVANLQLDDVAKMSTTELRAAIRKHRKEATEKLEDKDRVLQVKNSLIEELQNKLAKAQGEKNKRPEEVPMPAGTAELKTLTDTAHKINASIGSVLHRDIKYLMDAFDGDLPPRAMRLAAAQSIGLLITTLHEVADYFGLQPETEISRAAEDPAKADMAEFEAWQAEQAEGWAADGLTAPGAVFDIIPDNIDE